MKRSTLPSLDDLRAFETAARLGSVRAAAGELALTHGAVSRRVAKLARDLGFRLFEPEGRGLRLTPDGAALSEAATRAFGLIEDSLATIRSASGSAPIVLSCERSLAMRWLIPRLSAFQDRHPEIEIHLSTGGGSPDFARERVTLAIRRLDFALDPAWTVRELMPERVGPVMVPGLRDRFALGDYVALGSRTRPKAWADWQRAHPHAPPPRSVQLLDHHFLMTEAALGGLGVALAPEVIVGQDVAQGKLAAPYGFTPDGTRYGLIYPGSYVPTGHADKLCGWLFDEAARDARVPPPAQAGPAPRRP
ncbi:LysR family transcriptional regulator [Methylobacterium platani]|uniref:Transcriptional regulator n=1 Tax=Methylobacterium platani TaxID=427683 RepID=A0A179SG48_9HYPH|nr:LysR family transcriptional regulator [Methylobacterium platani]OAS25855.1 transcriptional regulator [Methylobacterium platani]